MSENQIIIFGMVNSKFIEQNIIIVKKNKKVENKSELMGQVPLKLRNYM